MSLAIARASKNRNLVARDIRIRVATSPMTEIFMSANCTLTVGSLMYPPSMIFSAMVGQFAAGLALAFDLADHGHFEHAVLVDGAHLERLRVCRAGDVGSRERIVGGRRVERHCQFGVLAVDDDRQPVERLDADLSVFGDLFRCEGLGVLQIPYALLCGARNEQYAEDRCPDEKAELLHF